MPAIFREIRNTLRTFRSHHVFLDDFQRAAFRANACELSYMYSRTLDPAQSMSYLSTFSRIDELLPAA